MYRKILFPIDVRVFQNDPDLWGSFADMKSCSQKIYLQDSGTIRAAPWKEKFVVETADYFQRG